MALPADTKEKFQQLLGLAGVSLTWSALALTAPVDREVPDTNAFRIKKQGDHHVMVRALASVFPDTLPDVGAMSRLAAYLPAFRESLQQHSPPPRKPRISPEPAFARRV